MLKITHHGKKLKPNDPVIINGQLYYPATIDNIVYYQSSSAENCYDQRYESAEEVIGYENEIIEIERQISIPSQWGFRLAGEYHIFDSQKEAIKSLEKLKGSIK
jgi:hypothetical protein